MGFEAHSGFIMGISGKVDVGMFQLGPGRRWFIKFIRPMNYSDYSVTRVQHRECRFFENSISVVCGFIAKINFSVPVGLII